MVLNLHLLESGVLQDKKDWYTENLLSGAPGPLWSKQVAGRPSGSPAALALVAFLLPGLFLTLEAGEHLRATPVPAATPAYSPTLAAALLPGILTIWQSH